MPHRRSVVIPREYSLKRWGWVNWKNPTHPFIYGDLRWKSIWHFFVALKFVNEEDIVTQITMCPSDLYVKWLTQRRRRKAPVQRNYIAAALKKQLYEHPEFTKQLIQTGDVVFRSVDDPELQMYLDVLMKQRKELLCVAFPRLNTLKKYLEQKYLTIPDLENSEVTDAELALVVGEKFYSHPALTRASEEDKKDLDVRIKAFTGVKVWEKLHNELPNYFNIVLQAQSFGNKNKVQDDFEASLKFAAFIGWLRRRDEKDDIIDFPTVDDEEFTEESEEEQFIVDVVEEEEPEEEFIEAGEEEEEFIEAGEEEEEFIDDDGEEEEFIDDGGEEEEEFIEAGEEEPEEFIEVEEEEEEFIEVESEPEEFIEVGEKEEFIDVGEEPEEFIEVGEEPEEFIDDEEEEEFMDVDSEPEKFIDDEEEEDEY